ncbi:MAG TPA: peptidoglycan DD-metalloendopeptidase family protein, partial [Thermohalobaculum sp.]|nr:peptidoglycan DD-metalloendopeptidase family protein [Thermohalobaculum sp.]
MQIRHYRPGHTSCSEVGCYHSNYMHLTSAVVNIDEAVSKGDLVGYTGESGSGFAHLHFEIRDAPPNDPTSSWQRDAITALGVLPYQS